MDPGAPVIIGVSFDRLVMAQQFLLAMGGLRDAGSLELQDAVVVNKSTVPVGSTKVVERALGRPDVSVVSNPEFLREGAALDDFLHPDRGVIGADNQSAAVRVAVPLSSAGQAVVGLGHLA